LDCSKCGEESGYSVVFRNEDVAEFLCDECLEIRSGHRDCVKTLEDCEVCSSLAVTLEQRWRRQLSLDKLLKDSNVDRSQVSAVPLEMNNNKGDGNISDKGDGDGLNDHTSLSIEKVSDQVISSELEEINSSQIFDLHLKVMDCAVCETRSSIDFGEVSINGDFFCEECIYHANNVF